MLWIIEALFLILAAVGQDHSVTAEILPLDMALNSVDDQFKGCTKEMGKLVETELLKTERKNSPEFNKAWGIGERNAKKPKDNLNRLHSVAIYVYTDNYIYSGFNTAGRNDKTKYRYKSYKWYSLHFLLTEAIQILKTKQKYCYSAYRGVSRNFDMNVQNKEVRFGSFTSSSLNKQEAKKFAKGISCFEIKTCYGAKLKDYSRFPNEEEVLIPPYEKFKVTAVKTRRNNKNLWCDTVFVLESTGVRSDLNCVLVRKNPYIFKKIFKKY